MFFSQVLKWGKGRRPVPVYNPLQAEKVSACFLHFNGPWWVKLYMEELFAQRFHSIGTVVDLVRQGNATRRKLQSSNESILPADNKVWDVRKY